MVEGLNKKSVERLNFRPIFFKQVVLFHSNPLSHFQHLVRLEAVQFTQFADGGSLSLGNLGQRVA